MQQKTWLELLGPMTNNDAVEGRVIFRATGPTTRKVLWSFDSNQEANQALNQWMIESFLHPTEGTP